MNSEIRISHRARQGWHAWFIGDLKDELSSLIDSDHLPVALPEDTPQDKVISHLSHSYPDADIRVLENEIPTITTTCYDTMLFSLRRHSAARRMHFWAWISVTVTLLSIQNGADLEQCLADLARTLAEPGAVSRPGTGDCLTDEEIGQFLTHMRRIVGQ